MLTMTKRIAIIQILAISTHKIKWKFEKGCLPDFSKEIFTGSKRIAERPPVYKLKDFEGEELQGTFYQAVMLHTRCPFDLHCPYGC